MLKKSYQWCEIPEEVMCTSNNKENLNAEPHYEFCQTHLSEYNASNSDGTLSANCWLTSRSAHNWTSFWGEGFYNFLPAFQILYKKIK